KKVIFYGVLAKHEAVRNLLVAQALSGVLGHLQFPLREQADFALLEALAGWSASQRVQQDLTMPTARPNFSSAHPLDTGSEVRHWLGAGKKARRTHTKSRQNRTPGHGF